MKVEDLQIEIKDLKQQCRDLQEALNNVLLLWIQKHGIDWNVIFPALALLTKYPDLIATLAIYDEIDAARIKEDLCQ